MTETNLMSLPRVLAGPIVRRVTPDRVLIWVATSEEIAPHAVIYTAEPDGSVGEPVGSGQAHTVRLGPRLFVHLTTAVPANEGFPTDRLLAYDLDVTGSNGTRDDTGSAPADDSLAYQPFSLPTFCIRRAIPELNFAHGSCRLLHGKGEDSFLTLDELMARTADDPDHRPGALFLTGDQIYADDVAGPLILHVRRLADGLMGDEDAHSVPGVPNLTQLPVYGRAELAAQGACLTSDKASNHLMSFGEFAAMYLMAWNPMMWPAAFAPADAVIPRRTGLATTKTMKQRAKYRMELRDLKRARAALPAVRRVLANTPTYMIFDDHDVTDDWNLTRGWRNRVRASPTGCRVITNALAAFWAFQGWGNDPAAYDAPFIDDLTAHVFEHGLDSAFDEMMWEFDRWSFYAPTDPPTIVLDTRTQRDYDSEEGAARLLGAEGRKRTAGLARAAGLQLQSPLIVISPVPVFGLELQERRQKALNGKLGPYEIDFEAWHSDLHGLVDLMELLIEDLALSTCLLVSGDIHYGCNAQALFSLRGRELPIVQIVSSACKHSGVVSKALLDVLGRLVHEEHERLGWHRPLQAGRDDWLRRRLVTKAVNTDEWDEDAPVFLAPKWIARLDISNPPDYAEYRRYVYPSEERSSKLVAENNIGVVSLRDHQITHRLLSRARQGTHEHTAHLRLGWAPPAATNLAEATKSPRPGVGS